MIDKLINDLNQLAADAKEARRKAIALKQNPARLTMVLGGIRQAIDNAELHQDENQAPAPPAQS
jgi:hypothetical protein